MQCSVHRPLSTRAAVSRIYVAQGMAGLFVGYGAQLAREVPFDAFEFAIWEKLKYHYEISKMRDRPSYTNEIYTLSPMQSAVCGALAGAIAGAATTPLDVCKTRIMTQSITTQGGKIKYKGVCDAMVKIVQEEAVFHLMKGVVPRVLWIGIGGFLMFGAYEFAKDALFRSLELGRYEPAERACQECKCLKPTS
uniref:Uncharacterized protein n=1 Tax=Vitrella brassicaformis TaxID=1169539 RepID=A0A7S1KDV8_9ALVE|mmetsp:Transcript_47517/g.118750  ORF Transcript_47517/g.118750 Transcript_47517/m.118750 type:complete len:193 (+) Transcript_47517:475-1053(+)